MRDHHKSKCNLCGKIDYVDVIKGMPENPNCRHYLTTGIIVPEDQWCGVAFEYCGHTEVCVEYKGHKGPHR